MNQEYGNTLNILLADDDADDRMFFTDAISNLPLQAHVTTLNDGVQLMDYLLSPGTILPYIIFLDLNMPLKNGFQCLSEIRSNNKLKELFVVIYSTTTNPAEIAETFNGGANLFINKPNSFTGLKLVLEKVLNLNLNDYIRPDREKFVFENGET